MPKKKNSGLGRGLDAIFLENSLDEDKIVKENQISVLKISLIDPKGDQPRKNFDKQSLEELAASIRENGLLQPIIVREYGEGRYQIIAGERRFRASKLAEISEIPAVIMNKGDREAAEIALIENIQREDLNPIEEAMGFRALQEDYGLTQEELSERIGKSRSAIANAMRLLDLPEEILSLLAEGKLSAGHGRTLLAVRNTEAMIELAKRVISEDLSVRRLEEEVKKANRNKGIEPEEDDDTLPVINYFREMEIRVQSHLGRQVKISEKGRKKTITLFYEDNEDLDELLKTICGDDFLDEY